MGSSVMPQYLDENGNPTATPTYLDENGNPQGGNSGGGLGNFASHALSRVAALPMGLYQSVRHPIDTAVSAVQQFKDLTREGGEALGRGDYPLAAARTVESILPGIGPSIAHGFKTIQSGDTSGGIGDMVGDIGPVLAAPMISKGIGKGLQSVAPDIAEKAMGITARDRMHGLGKGEIGRAILNETSGVKPEVVSESASNRIGELAKDVESKARLSGARGVEVPLAPARGINEATKTLQSSAGESPVPAQTEPVKRFLTNPGANFRGKTEYAPGANTPITLKQAQSPVLGPTGQPLPGPVSVVPGKSPEPVIAAKQSPTEFLNIRRRFNDAFGPGNWNDTTPDTVTHNFQKVYGGLTGAFHDAVPGTAQADKLIHALSPVVRQADAVARREGVGPRIMTRVERPTGALVPALAGYASGGAPGAALGAAIPEFLSSPSPRMAAARTLFGTGKLALKPGVGRSVAALALAGQDQE